MCLSIWRQWRISTKPVWSIQSGSRDTTLASSPGSTLSRLHYPASRFLSSASSVPRAWRRLMRAPWLRPRREKTATNARPRLHSHVSSRVTHIPVPHPWLHVCIFDSTRTHTHIHTFRTCNRDTHPPTRSVLWNYVFLQQIFILVRKGASAWFFFFFF